MSQILTAGVGAVSLENSPIHHIRESYQTNDTIGPEL